MVTTLAHWRQRLSVIFEFLIGSCIFVSAQNTHDHKMKMTMDLSSPSSQNARNFRCESARFVFHVAVRDIHDISR
jgi:hypothetical protein